MIDVKLTPSGLDGMQD